MSANQGPVRVFIGSGEASLLERKVLIYSLHKHARCNLEVFVFNGTHNAIERDGQMPQPAPLSLRLKYRNYTEFSLYRYVIPEVCRHEGRAIYLDSDMICLKDIGELFHAPMNGNDMLALPEYEPGNWTTSVLLMDCSRVHFPLERIFDEIDKGLYTYTDFARLNPKFLQHHRYQVGQLDPRWNEFDRHDEQTKLIHYTDLLRQPWKFPGHQYSELWFTYLQEARSAGYVTDDDINKSIMRGYVRPNLLEPDQTPRSGSSSKVVRELRRVVQQLASPFRRKAA